jgi:hypothetical protein
MSDTKEPQTLHDLAVQQARGVAGSEGFQGRIYDAIAVQRPVVLEFLRALRREKPNATAAELLKELENRYVATVTVTNTGVGASAAIPGVGIPLALGLGVADLIFFYETSALYVLSVAELHGVPVTDADRAKPLVFGMLLGEKSQSQVSKLVMSAVGAGGIDAARTAAGGAVAKVAPQGWGEVLTQQLPDSALAPLTVVIAREALTQSGKLGAGTLGKAVPFGIGAVVGGVGSFFFGRDVVKAARRRFRKRRLPSLSGSRTSGSRPERAVRRHAQCSRCRPQPATSRTSGRRSGARSARPWTSSDLSISTATACPMRLER